MPKRSRWTLHYANEVGVPTRLLKPSLFRHLFRDSCGQDGIEFGSGGSWLNQVKCKDVVFFKRSKQVRRMILLNEGRTAEQSRSLCDFS